METSENHLRQRLKKSDSEDPTLNTVQNPSRISYDERKTSTPPPSTKFEDSLKPPGFTQVFLEDLFSRRSAEKDRAMHAENTRKIYEFLRIPLELEKFVFFGLLQCLDAFLHIFTLLPLRLLNYCFGKVCRGKKWTYTETCDALKLLIILCGSMLIREIDFSVIYHEIRGQGMFKLFVIYNMLGMGDQLLSSLGQDILDSLYLTANIDRITPGKSLRILVHLVVAIGYVTLHALLVILQATTMNVAFNSQSQPVMRTIIVSNFKKLTGEVFKKFGEVNLFQMSCKDVRERFHNFVLLFVVVIRNMTATNWNVGSLWEMAPDIILVIAGECLVDWWKHAFSTKFNEIDSAVFKGFQTRIAFDVINCRDPSSPSDFSDQVSRRMGLIPIPLSIMIILVLSQTFSLHFLVIFWLVVLLLKVINKTILIDKACRHVNHFHDNQAHAKFNGGQSASNSPLIDFTDVLHQPVTGKKLTVSDIFLTEEQLNRRRNMAKIPLECLNDGGTTPGLANIPLNDDPEQEDWDDVTSFRREIE